MVEENEIIPLIYALFQGLKAYREAYNKLNDKGEEIKEIALEEVMSKYKQIEHLLFFLEKVVR
ncbi:MAG: hypothetical protein QW423_02230 [Candidatus Aenigmatarchaeota archaeon]